MMEPNINSSSQNFPEGSENLSFDEKQRLSEEGAPPFSANFSHLARATLERLNNYKGDQADIRDPSFSSLSQDEKSSIYSASLKAINEIGVTNSLSDFLRGKIITLVGEPGISFDNNQLKIGRGATKEEIVKFIEEKTLNSIKEETSANNSSMPQSSTETSTEEIVPESNADEIIERVQPESAKEDLAELASQKIVTEEVLPKEETKDEEKVENNEAGFVTEPPIEPVDASNEPKVPEITPVESETASVMPGAELKMEKIDIPEVVEIKDEEKTEDKIEFALVNKIELEYGDVEDWEKLDDLRKQAVREELNQRKSGILGLNLKWQDYENQRELLEDKIKNKLREQAGDNLTSEQENELKRKIQEVSYAELIENEEKARHKDIRDIKGETLTGKVLEQAKYLLNTKVAQWYFKQNKWTRLAINTAIATAVGYGVGTIAASGAIGYSGARLVRGAASFTASGAANKWAQKKWSIDEINKEEERAMETIKASDQSLIERSDFYRNVKEEADKERRKFARNKILTTVGAGAGAGLLSGLVEHIDMGTGGGAKTVAETQPVKPNVPEQAPKSVEPTPEATPVPPVEKIFDNPEILKHEVVAGDSAWKILKGTLENNEQFKGMTEAQKSYVLSTMTNKVLQNPEDYGLHNKGLIHVGDKVDLTKLFDDAREVKSIFNKAKETIIEGGPQEKSILENNEKISEWVKVNPDKELTSDKLTEILNTKPKIKVPIPEEFKEPEVPLPEVPKPEIPEPEEAKVNIDSKIIPEDMKEGVIGAAVTGGAGLVTMSVLEKERRQQMEKEIEEAKKRLGVLEEGNSQNSNLERSFARDLNSAKNGSELDRAVSSGKEQTVNHFFTEGFILKKEGMKSKKWKFIKDISFAKLEKYYKGDSNMSGLNLEVMVELNKSNKYKDFFDHVSWLKDQTDGVVILAEGEDPSIELVLEERGKYLLKNPQLAKLKKVA